MKREFHVLNLGAGVQSSALYLMFMRGKIGPALDFAIFADTGEEPGAVYEHLRYLSALGGPHIIVDSVGRLGDDLMLGRNSTGQRFASIPAYTLGPGGIGRVRRQCSKEYKVEPIERAIRRTVLGLAPRRRIPADVMVHQYYGISMDEAGRAKRLRERWKHRRMVPHFPLIDRFFTRPDCLDYLREKLPYQVVRSACVFCPYRSDSEWLWLRESDPQGWERAVLVDAALRGGAVVNRGMDAALYVHRSCVPLGRVVLDPRPNWRELQLSLSFAEACEGVCGV